MSSPAQDSTSSGRKGYCVNTACQHPNNEHKYVGCMARGCRKQWKRCQECRPYRLCLTCSDHPAASPYDESCAFGEIRGWGTPTEPLSASQAAGWAERSSREWESIFNDARGHRTKFSEAPEALPFHARVPIFDRSLDGKVVDGTLRSSAVFEWDVRPSIAGLVPAYATTSSECIFAIQSPTLVDFDNNYPRYPEGTTHLRMNHRDMYDSVADLPHTPSICADDLTEPNYLGLLTLAWGYVLSAYWTATQKGKIYYTEHKAPCNSSSPDCVS